MCHINPPENPGKKSFFGAYFPAWWHTQLSQEEFRQLNEGMDGVKRRKILKLLPTEKLGERFHEFQGRARSCMRCAG